MDNTISELTFYIHVVCSLKIFIPTLLYSAYVLSPLHV